ncbi:hypothetical protein BHE74_00026355, partial [Ensete ventricosum]
ATTSSLPRTTGPPTWPTQHGKPVGRRYEDANGRTAGLTQVRPIPQQLYDRPDTGKADTFTCGRIPHRKDDQRDGSVRRQAYTGLNQQCLLYSHRGGTHLLDKHHILP